MKRFKKELSWLLVAALVVSSLVIGLGQLQTSAVTQATGQMGSYRLRVSTAGQDCNGTGTADNLTIYISYDDGTSNNANTIPGEGSPNYFEAGNTDTIDLSPQLMAKPINQIWWVGGGDRWKTNWAAIDYYDGGAWCEIANMGGFDGGGGTRYFTYPHGSSGYSLDNSSLNKTLTFNGNGGTVNGSSSFQYYSEMGATLPAQTLTMARTGYTFTGWSPSIPSTGPSADTTYTAQWSVNYYNLTFDANGGTGGTGPTSTAYGASISAPTVSRTGYTLTGWSPSVPSTMPAANSTYTAQWSINSYTIYFDEQGGSAVSDITQNYGTAVTAPADPTKTGYTFAGWSPAVPSTMPANNTTCVAQWSVNSYTIYFDEQGGSTVPDITQNYGTTVTAPANPTKTGYTFAGWSPAIPGTMPANNTTCVAQWTINSYTVTFDANGGTGGWSQSLAYGSTITPPTVTRTGYTFTGWSPSPPGTVPVGGGTYVAQWSVNSYTIYFDEQGGSAVSDITQNYGTSVTAPANPTKTGYTFTGWSPACPSTMPANDTYCVAQWTINQYTISFNSNGGSAVSSITQNYGTQASEPTAPTKTGNTFAGWYSDAGLTNPVSWPYTILGDVTFYAKWTVNNYNITFDANGGTGGWGPTSMAYGATLTAPTVTRTGYTFNGWSPSVPSTVPAADSTYTAQWVINQYTVSFNSNGGSAVSDITQNYNTQVSEPAAPTKTGNTFVGWYSEPGLANPVSWPYTLGAANVTFYAKWTVNNYNITFDANGGTGGTGPTSMAYGAALSAPEVARTGYVLTGWSPSVPATVPAADTTYTAQWSLDAFTIYFDEAGGSAVADITQDYGTPVTAPADPTRTGYTFLGWDPAVPAAMPAEDTYCVAQWQLNTYTITWDANGGTGGGQNECDHGAMPTPVGAGTKEGYTFTGWDPEVVAATDDTTYTAQWSVNSYDLTFDANGGTGGTGPTSTEYGTAISAPTVTRTGYRFTGWEPIVAATMPAADTTYIAQWAAQSTITFDVDGGTPAIDPITLDEGEAVTAPDDPTKEGFIFAGWSPEVPATMPADDVECVAQWTPDEPELIPAEGSTTIIDDTDGLVYGLIEGTTQADFEALFVEILGNGRLEITTLDGEFGTGTYVELIDNVTEEVVVSYYVVIFGDVNGDGIAGAVDADLINFYENFMVEWDTETEPYLFAASDLNGDGNSEAVDADMINFTENFQAYIDQTTGLAYAY